MPKLRTPLIKPRQQGGTFYTFGSALEDVGLNINELKNKVSLSHYVLLNIPAFEGLQDSTVSTGSNSENVGDYSFAEYFQNYALNMETVIRNMEFNNRHYNFSESLTVSERVFWKWMQHQGFISFEKDIDETGKETGYYIDSSTYTNDSVIKGFGAITAGAQRTDAYGIYNETFVQIPSSYGQMKVLLKPVDDTNYFISNTEDNIFKGTSSPKWLIENIEESEIASSEDPVLSTGLTAKAIFDDDETASYIINSEKDELCVEFSLSKLREYYNDESISYDDIGIGVKNLRPEDVDGNYEFNAILVYYSVYDSTGKNTLATNAYGLLLLDSCVSDGELSFKYPSLVKKQSSSSDSGNSYSFRLNIKTTSVYNGDIQVQDNSTPAYEMSTEFNDVVRNLAVAVETLRSNANLIAVLCNQNAAIKQMVITALDNLDGLKKDVNSLKSGNMKAIKAKSISADAASISNIDSSLSIADETTRYGSFNKDTFTYNNIKGTLIESPIGKFDSVKTYNVITDSGEITFNDNHTTGERESLLAKVNSQGIFTENSLYVKNPVNSSTSNISSIDADVVSDIINKIIVRSDYTVVLPDSTDIDTASDPVFSDMVSNLQDSNTENSIIHTEDGTYVNLPVLVAVILAYVKSLKLLLQDINLGEQENGSTLSDIADSLSKISAIDHDVNDASTGIKARLTALEDVERVDYSDDINRLDSSIADLQDSLDDFIDSYNDDKDDIDSSISDINDKIDSLDSSINELATLVNDYNDSILAVLNSIIND